MDSAFYKVKNPAQSALLSHSIAEDLSPDSITKLFTEYMLIEKVQSSLDHLRAASQLKITDEDADISNLETQQYHPSNGVFTDDARVFLCKYLNIKNIPTLEEQTETGVETDSVAQIILSHLVFASALVLGRHADLELFSCNNLSVTDWLLCGAGLGIHKTLAPCLSAVSRWQRRAFREIPQFIELEALHSFSAQHWENVPIRKDDPSAHTNTLPLSKLISYLDTEGASIKRMLKAVPLEIYCEASKRSTSSTPLEYITLYTRPASERDALFNECMRCTGFQTICIGGQLGDLDKGYVERIGRVPPAFSDGRKLPVSALSVHVMTTRDSIVLVPVKGTFGLAGQILIDEAWVPADPSECTHSPPTTNTTTTTTTTTTTHTKVTNVDEDDEEAEGGGGKSGYAGTFDQDQMAISRKPYTRPTSTEKRGRAEVVPSKEPMEISSRPSSPLIIPNERKNTQQQSLLKFGDKDDANKKKMMNASQGTVGEDIRKPLSAYDLMLKNKNGKPSSKKQQQQATDKKRKRPSSGEHDDDSGPEELKDDCNEDYTSNQREDERELFMQMGRHVNLDACSDDEYDILDNMTYKQIDWLDSLSIKQRERFLAEKRAEKRKKQLHKAPLKASDVTLKKPSSSARDPKQSTIKLVESVDAKKRAAKEGRPLASDNNNTAMEVEEEEESAVPVFKKKPAVAPASSVGKAVAAAAPAMSLQEKLRQRKQEAERALHAVSERSIGDDYMEEDDDGGGRHGDGNDDEDDNDYGEHVDEPNEESYEGDDESDDDEGVPSRKRHKGGDDDDDLPPPKYYYKFSDKYSVLQSTLFHAVHAFIVNANSKMYTGEKVSDELKDAWDNMGGKTVNSVVSQLWSSAPKTPVEVIEFCAAFFIPTPTPEVREKDNWIDLLTACEGIPPPVGIDEDHFDMVLDFVIVLRDALIKDKVLDLESLNGVENLWNRKKKTQRELYEAFTIRPSLAKFLALLFRLP